MKFRYDNRSWHAWISVVLAVPIVIVAVTAIFIAHDDALGTKEKVITPYVSWLPGYSDAAVKMQRMEVQTALATRDGAQWLGTKAGLYRIEQGRATPVEALGGTHVRALVDTPAGLVAATKNGVWLRQSTPGQGGGETWQRTARGDAWSASVGAGGVIHVAMKDAGVLASTDGASWKNDTAALTALAAMPVSMAEQKPVTLGNLVMDLHTGKAFFGKEWEWIWIDLIGFVMAFLGVTGVVMWWRGEKRRRELEAQLAAASATPASPAVAPVTSQPVTV